MAQYSWKYVALTNWILRLMLPDTENTPPYDTGLAVLKVGSGPSLPLFPEVFSESAPFDQTVREIRMPMSELRENRGTSRG